MAKFIFRRIAGRIVPIAVEKATRLLHGGRVKEVSITLKSQGKTVGDFSAMSWLNRPARFNVVSHLEEGWRGKGLGSEFYKKLAKEVKKHGGKSIEGTTQNPAVISIRKKIGPTKVNVRSPGYAKVWTWLGKKGKK